MGCREEKAAQNPRVARPGLEGPSDFPPQDQYFYAVDLRQASLASQMPGDQNKKEKLLPPRRPGAIKFKLPATSTSQSFCTPP